MAGTTGIQTIQNRIASLASQLQEAQTAGNANRIQTLQNRLDKNRQDLAFRQSKQAELSSTRAMYNAQLGFQNAQYGQQIGAQQVSQEGDLLQSQRDLEAAYRDWLASFGGRDMLRSGVYQQQVALGEEGFALERARIVREYNQTIMGLQAEQMAGANAVALQRAAQIAQIKAAYQLARLQNRV